jgi:ubiquitin-conjugating enzyme E2 Q
MGAGQIKIPEPSYKIEKLIEARRSEYIDEEFDEDDQIVFSHSPESQNSQHQNHESISSAPGKSGQRKVPPANDWQHDEAYVRAALEQLLPPPEDSSVSAIMGLQREFKAMLKEQDGAFSLKELGWYMPTAFNEENLFQWIVEMHSFDPDLPIAKDLAAK